MGIYVPHYVKKKGAYGADQIEKVGAFRAERTVKAVPLELIELGKNGCIQKKWVLIELIELKKVGALRANKTKKSGGGALPRHIPVLL